MDTVFDSLLALLAIILPLGLAYIIMYMQTRSQSDEKHKDGTSIVQQRRAAELDDQIRQ